MSLISSSDYVLNDQFNQFLLCGILDFFYFIFTSIQYLIFMKNILLIYMTSTFYLLDFHFFFDSSPVLYNTSTSFSVSLVISRPFGKDTNCGFFNDVFIIYGPY